MLAVTIVAVAGLLAACVPGDGPPPAGLSCAWGILGSKDALNVAYPDTSATYWGMHLNLLAGDRVLIDGTYPDARYMSFVSYGPTGSAIDSVADRDLAPTTGSNPFADESGTGGTYHLEVSADAIAGAVDDRLATGGVLATVLYRVYVPDGTDPTGDVGLPEVSVRRTDGTTVAVPTCSSPTADPALADLIGLAGPATDQPAQHPPTFQRPAALGGLYANPDNAYVAAVAGHVDDRVLVISGTAPSVPDTEGGDSPAVPSDLRFWSVCTNEYRKPYPVSECLHDTEVPLDTDGRYTIVVSTADDRPSNATAAEGVAWLDWGSTAQDMLLILRNMLPASDFHRSTFDVAPGSPAGPAMGEFAPVASECTTAAFEAAPTDPASAAACGLA
jgi:hypothetical protein